MGLAGTQRCLLALPQEAASGSGWLCSWQSCSAGIPLGSQARALLIPSAPASPSPLYVLLGEDRRALVKPVTQISSRDGMKHLEVLRRNAEGSQSLPFPSARQNEALNTSWAGFQAVSLPQL